MRTILFLLAAVIVGAGIYLYPAWKAARAMQDKMALPFRSFELEVELDRERVPADQAKMFERLAALTGIEEGALYRLSVRGGMEEDKVHLTVYPEGRTEPLFEFYLSDDMNVINETMVYNAVRSHLAGQFGLLEYLMPVQEETLYLTLEQVEQLFGTDLSGLAGFRLQTTDGSITAKEYFFLLAVMSREKQGEGYRFTLDTEQAGICFETAYGKEDTAVKLELRVQDPEDVLHRADNVLPGLENWLPGEGLEGLKSFSLTLEPGEGETITMPTNLAGQETIDTIAAIREWFQGTFGG